MNPNSRSWMRPDDLIPAQLDLLPWPAYTVLVERFFSTLGYRIRLVGSEAGQTDFILVDRVGARHLLRCCSERAASQLESLDRLRHSMNDFHIVNGMLASPKDFSVALVSADCAQGIELYSGDRLRACIERLPLCQRRAVLDSIKAKPGWK